MTGNWKSVLRLEKNNSGYDYICGDIHGCFTDLENELENIRFNKTSDRLFCVGDLIDRGPHSELAAQYMTSPWFFTVLGNHEHMFLMANLHSPEQISYQEDHIRNGGSWSFKMEPGKAYNMLAAIDKLPLIIQVGDIIIAHASLPVVNSLEEIEKNPLRYIDTILWHRGKYLPVTIPGISMVYVGHSIIARPAKHGKTTNIDTGAFLKYWGRQGKLTIISIGGTSCTEQ